jgi:hypothetical protein
MESAIMNPNAQVNRFWVVPTHSGL